MKRRPLEVIDLHLEVESFLEMATSRRPLVREDDASRNLRGMRDLESGVRYVTPQEDFQRYRMQPDSAAPGA